MPRYDGPVIPDQTATAKPYHGPVIPLGSTAGTSSEAPSPPSGFIATTASNIVPSAERFATGIGETVLHPINTARAVGSLFTNPKARQAAVNFLKKRYGGVDELKHTIETDPIGFLSDVSGVLSGAGLAADAARGAALVSDATRAASVAERAGKIAKKAATATNPLSAVGASAKGAGKVAKPVYETAVGITTGSGAPAISEAFKASPEFMAAMRGKIPEKEVFDRARQQIQQLRDERNIQYRKDLENLRGSSEHIDMAPIRKELADVLHDFNVRMNRDGTLDFSRSTLQEGAPDVQAIYDDVMRWNANPSDQTPAMLDILKRRISDRYSKSGHARAAVQRLATAVKQQIVKAVPEYAQMSAKYEDASSTLDTINKALSTGDRAAADTALRKIMQAMREEKSFRRDQLRELDQRTGGNLTGLAAGRVMNPGFAAHRLRSYLFIGPEAAAGMWSHNPFILALLPLASPRIVGEFTAALGKTSRAAAPYAKASAPALNIGAMIQRTAPSSR